jgi:sulfonate transport system ATP-binding protein
MAEGGMTAALEDVTRRFGERTVVERCSLRLAPGEVTAMVGPSGCGKSTIAFLLAGYDEPDEGHVVFDGIPVRGPSPDRLVVFQESALMPWLTTFENVMFGPRAQRRRGIEARAEELLERVGLTEFRDRYPSELSGGMQRRAELARALINEPAVLILDEPFRGLDAMTRSLMQEYVAELLAEQPRTTLLITTDIDEAIRLGDRVLVMTNRPTRVRRAFDAHPDIKAEALELLHEEALRSFDTRPGAHR